MMTIHKILFDFLSVNALKRSVGSEGNDDRGTVFAPDENGQPEAGKSDGIRVGICVYLALADWIIAAYDMAYAPIFIFIHDGL